MKIHHSFCIAALLTILVVFNACEKEENENNVVVSSFNSDDSHHAGDNCMNCHKSGGSGEGWFTVAGTVYNQTGSSTLPGGTIKIYSSPNGTGDLKATIQVDKKGNFYTTQPIDFGSGLYVQAEGSTETKYMSSKITTGQCNSCHDAGNQIIGQIKIQSTY